MKINNVQCDLTDISFKPKPLDGTCEYVQSTVICEMYFVHVICVGSCVVFFEIKCNVVGYFDSVNINWYNL